jgi:hypothetical protein
MSIKTRISVGATAVLLILAYGVAQSVKEKADERSATVTVTWVPERGSPGVVIVVYIAMKYKVSGRTFVTSPFSETYPVKRGDQILVNADPKAFTVNQITCRIDVTGQLSVSGSGNGHVTCLTAVV